MHFILLFVRCKIFINIKQNLSKHIFESNHLKQLFTIFKQTHEIIMLCKYSWNSVLMPHIPQIFLRHSLYFFNKRMKVSPLISGFFIYWYGVLTLSDHELFINTFSSTPILYKNDVGGGGGECLKGFFFFFFLIYPFILPKSDDLTIKTRK